MNEIKITNKGLTYTAALFVVLAGISSSFMIGYNWHFENFTKKTSFENLKKDQSLLYLELRIVDSENWLSYYEKQIEVGNPLTAWEQRRYDLLKASITEMLKQKQELMSYAKPSNS